MHARYLAALSLALLPLAGMASAAPVGVGNGVFAASSGPITAIYVGDGGSYSAKLYLVTGADDFLVFDDQIDVPGNTTLLGEFIAGQELVFKLVTGGYSYLTGAASGNPDGLAHAYATTIDDFTFVGFEDIFGGGDGDYDDIVFKFSNTVGQTTQVPVPAAGLLLVGGLGAIGALRRRKNG